MPSTKELRTRIRSVKSTAQITKAMQMVSATKMRRAQNQAVAARSYTQTLSQILSSTLQKVNVHPLMKTNDSTHAGVLLLTTDRGLCGSLNANVIRVAQTSPELSKYKEITYFTVGKKGRDYVVRSSQNLEADFDNQEKIQFRQATSIRRLLTESFLNGKFGALFVAFPNFVSTLRQEPSINQLLPITREALQEFLKEKMKDEEVTTDYIFEPTLSNVVDYALIHYLETVIYQSLLETKASEHSARMIAMQNATNNAKDIVDALTLEYNQVRQTAITTQILEIASAGAALE
jgi:F-type H+-transporting ATPase subunit gamma